MRPIIRADIALVDITNWALHLRLLEPFFDLPVEPPRQNVRPTRDENPDVATQVDFESRS
jgi:hypothetical protein